MKLTGQVTHVEAANSKKGDVYQRYSVLLDGTSLVEVMQMGPAKYAVGDDIELVIRFKRGSGFDVLADIRVVD